MVKSKEPKVHISGDAKPKSMILPLDPDIHAQIKSMAERTELTQPKIVALILQKAISSAEDYVNEIKKQHAAQQIKSLYEQKHILDAQIQKLKNQLED